MARAALDYAGLGFAVLPVCPPDHAGVSHQHRTECEKPGKAALVAWKRLQVIGSTPETIERWWQKWPTANIAVITGEPSALVVLDVDGDEGIESLRRYSIPKTPTVRSARGHRYHFAAPQVPLRKHDSLLPGVDLQADGAYGLLPPSRHASGVTYKWVIPLATGLVPCPDWIIELAQRPRSGRNGGDWQTRWRGVPEGKRTVTASQLTGHLAARGISFDEALEILFGWNLRNDPPLSDNEVWSIARDVYAREARSPRSHDATILGTGWVSVLRHSEVAVYEAIRVLEDRRGYAPGARLFVSHREVGDISGYSLGAVGPALHSLAAAGLIRYQPGVAGTASEQASEVERVLPLPAATPERAMGIAIRAVVHRLRWRTPPAAPSLP